MRPDLYAINITTIVSVLVKSKDFFLLTISPVNDMRYDCMKVITFRRVDADTWTHLRDI